MQKGRILSHSAQRPANSLMFAGWDFQAWRPATYDILQRFSWESGYHHKGPDSVGSGDAGYRRRSLAGTAPKWQDGPRIDERHPSLIRQHCSRPLALAFLHATVWRKTAFAGAWANGMAR